MRSRSLLSRILPLVYCALAIGLAAFLLPTALRPPPQQPPTSAQLSPDAPPDNEQVLVSELGRGMSTTAGTGTVTLTDEGPAVVALPTAPLRPPKHRCFGTPPRTTESLYSPPCVGAWAGTDNGGSTWRGVTKDEIRWAIVIGGDSGYEGPVDSAPRQNEAAVIRTWRVYQEYFNQRFEFYGRRLRFYMVRAGTNNWQEASKSRAATAKADQEYKVMGLTISTTATPAEDEGYKRGLMVMGGSHHSEATYRQHDPFAWAFVMDGSKLTRLNSELICKQLHNKPVSFSGDPTMNGTPRKLGAVVYHDAAYQGYERDFVEAMDRNCGWKPDDIQLFNDDDTPDQLATTMTKFRAQGITTIWCGCDATSPIVWTATATNQGYFPEWVHPGSAGIDSNSSGANYSTAQWRNSIGISSSEMNGSRRSGSDAYRAYKEIDPENEPEAAAFASVMHVAGAIQMAGPKLTPHTMKEGLLKRWPPRAPDPNWTIGGGYGPNDWTYSDYVTLVWWDPNAPRPDSSSSGAYRYVYNGKRFKLGEIPTEPIPFFKEGITQPPDQEKL